MHRRSPVYYFNEVQRTSDLTFRSLGLRKDVGRGRKDEKNRTETK